MAQPEFPAGSIVRAFMKGDIHYTGEFISCDGQLITLRTMGPQGAIHRDCFSIRGYAFECWEDLKGMEGIAFLRLMDEDDDWCERSYFEKFSQRELEILFLEGDVRIRDDAAERLPQEKLTELILLQENYEAAVSAYKRITEAKYVRFLSDQPASNWALDEGQANALRTGFIDRYAAIEGSKAPQETAALDFPPPPSRKKGGLPPTYVEKQQRLKEAAKASAEQSEPKPWWKFW